VTVLPDGIKNWSKVHIRRVTNNVRMAVSDGLVRMCWRQSNLKVLFQQRLERYRKTCVDIAGIQAEIQNQDLQNKNRSTNHYVARFGLAFFKGL
jgi:hypothetical protein